ncbi:transmembrane protein 102-like [Hyla sarda]|uniref:transmembrane protein 102-like n=1 Tax=Hyla sarda TaxID=327740 RepID=UPI0024C3AD8D|nr:transmembrane protein 102-like [Hyla sarda]XP_056409515.1 transmembrane protein 102-like [Hyla sarda]
MASPARPLTDLDFSSGCRIEELNKLLEELERRGSIALQGKEVIQTCVQAKDLIFSLVAQVHPLPSPNAFLLLSGGLCSGSIDVSPTDLGSTSPIICPSISYTLLVPIIRLPSPDLLVPCSPCHYLVPPSAWDPAPLLSGPHTSQVSPHDVSLWFSTALLSVEFSLSDSSLPLSLERAEPWGNSISLLLSTPSLFIRFDLVPVVEVHGWPQGVQYLDDWVAEDGLPPKVFHLFPWGPGGQWRVGFPGVELYMRRFLHPALSRVLRASTAVLEQILQKDGAPGPYIVWVTLLQACQRLPRGYLSQGHNAALCFLGLLEELSRLFLRGSCPNPFLPGCDLLLGSTHGPCLAQRISEVRAHPARYLRAVIREAKEVVKGGDKVEKEETEEKEERGSGCYPS